MGFEEKLLESFNCVKCRGRRAVANHVSLPKSGLPKIIKAGKYLFLTCTLCGYTEIYDEHAYANERERARKKSSAAQEEPIPPT